MRIKILIALILVVGLTGCYSNTQREDARELSKKNSNSDIVITENNIDLGDISMKDGKVDIDFIIKNNGSDPVVIIEGETSCTCTKAVIKTNSIDTDGSSAQVTSRDITMPSGLNQSTLVYQIINPGEEASVVATFNPNAHGPGGTGPIKRDVYFKTNSLQSPEIKLTFLGKVVK